MGVLTPNVTDCSYNATTKVYEITISTGYNEVWPTVISVVSDTPLVATHRSLSATTLGVYITNLSGTPVQAAFSFLVINK